MLFIFKHQNKKELEDIVHRLYILGIRDNSNLTKSLPITGDSNGNFQIYLDDKNLNILIQKAGLSDPQEALEFITEREVYSELVKTHYGSAAEIILPDLRPHVRYWQKSSPDEDFGIIAQKLSDFIVNTPYIDTRAFDPNPTHNSMWLMQNTGTDSIHLWRPNHDTTHSIRHVACARHVHDLVKQDGKPEYKTAARTMTPEEYQCMLLASFLARAGRTNEESGQVDESNATRSGQVFEIIATKLGFSPGLIKDVTYIVSRHIKGEHFDKLQQSQFSTDLTKIKLMKKILDVSHHADLQRCWSAGSKGDKIEEDNIAQLSVILDTKVNAKKYATKITSKMAHMSLATGERLLRNKDNASEFFRPYSASKPYDPSKKDWAVRNLAEALRFTSSSEFSFSLRRAVRVSPQTVEERGENLARMRLNKPYFAKTITGFATAKAWEQTRDVVTEGKRAPLRIKQTYQKPFVIRLGKSGKYEVHDVRNPNEAKFSSEKQQLAHSAIIPFQRRLPQHQSFTYYEPEDESYNPTFFGHDWGEEEIVGMRCSPGHTLINRLIATAGGTFTRFYSYRTREEAEKAITRYHNPRGLFGKILGNIGIGEEHSAKWATSLKQLKEFTTEQELPINECMIRTFWVCKDYSSQVVAYKQNTQSKFLAILRARDIETTLEQRKDFYKKQPYGWHKGYRVPISFWGNGKETQPRLYSRADQKRDLQYLATDNRSLLLQSLIYYHYETPGQLPQELFQVIINKLNNKEFKLFDFCFSESHMKNFNEFYQFIFTNVNLNDTTRKTMAEHLLSQTIGKHPNLRSAFLYAIEETPAKVGPILELFKSINNPVLKEDYITQLLNQNAGNKDAMDLAIEHNPLAVKDIADIINSIDNTEKKNQLLVKMLQKILIIRKGDPLDDPIRQVQEMRINGQPIAIFTLFNMGPEYALELISRGTDINLKDNQGNTLLHYAAYFGCADIITKLVERNADLNVRNNNGQTALDLCKQKDYTAIADLLIKHAAKPGAEQEPSALPSTQSHIAQSRTLEDTAHKNVPNNPGDFYKKMLLEHAEDPSRSLSPDDLVHIRTYVDISKETDTNGNTALILASYHGNKKLVQYLLSNQVDLDINNKDGVYAVSAAISGGNPDIALTLIKHGANIFQKYTDENGEPYFDFHEDLNSEINKVLDGTYINADKKEHFDLLLQTLINTKYESRINFYLEELNNILDKAKYHGLASAGKIANHLMYEHLLEAINSPEEDEEESIEIIEFILGEDSSFDLQKTSDSGASALYYAIEHGYHHLANSLIEKGAKLSAELINDYNILHLACKTTDASLELINKLLEFGADINRLDQFGNSPLYYAEEAGNSKIVEYLKNKVATAYPLTPPESTPKVITAQPASLLAIPKDRAAAATAKLQSSPHVDLDAEVEKVLQEHERNLIQMDIREHESRISTLVTLISKIESKLERKSGASDAVVNETLKNYQDELKQKLAELAILRSQLLKKPRKAAIVPDDSPEPSVTHASRRLTEAEIKRQESISLLEDQLARANNHLQYLKDKKYSNEHIDPAQKKVRSLEKKLEAAHEKASMQYLTPEAKKMTGDLKKFRKKLKDVFFCQLYNNEGKLIASGEYKGKLDEIRNKIVKSVRDSYEGPYYFQTIKVDEKQRTKKSTYLVTSKKENYTSQRLTSKDTPSNLISSEDDEREKFDFIQTMQGIHQDLDELAGKIREADESRDISHASKMR